MYRIYLAAPSSLSAAALAYAVAELEALGYAVAVPSAAIADDYDALRAARLFVTIGIPPVFEGTMAEVFGIPTLTLADVLVGVAA